MKILKRWGTLFAFAAVAAAQAPGVGSIFSGSLAAQLAAADTVTISSYALPQLVFGGGWYTAIYFNNRTTSSQTANVFFFNETGQPVVVPSLGSSSTSVNVPPAGAAIVEAPDAGGLQQGWARVDVPDGIVGYGVFRNTVPGSPPRVYEGVIPFANTFTTFNALIYDDTSTYATAVAFANPSGVVANINIRALNSAGQVIGSANQVLGPGARTAVVLRNFPGLGAIAGQRGAVEFTATTGAVSVLGLRFNQQAFTSIPPSQ